MWMDIYVKCIEGIIVRERHDIYSKENEWKGKTSALTN